MKIFIISLASLVVFVLCSSSLFSQIDNMRGSATFGGVSGTKASPWEIAYSIHQYYADNGKIGSLSLYYQPNYQDQSFNRYYITIGGFGRIYSDDIFLHPFWNLGLGVRFDVHEIKDKSWYEFNSYKNGRIGILAEMGLLKSYYFARNAYFAFLLKISSLLISDGVVLIPTGSVGISYAISL